MGKKRPTIDDVIDFIRDRVSTEGTLEKPFAGRRYSYSLVEPAVNHLHSVGEFLDLEPYDVHGTKYMWTDGGTNFPLARKATKALLKKITDTTKQPLEVIFTKVTQDIFRELPISRYGTTLSGMMSHTYSNSHYAAIRDLIDHDPEFASWRDLQPYDMLQCPKNTWHSEEGTPNITLAVQATKILLNVLQKTSKLPLEKLLPSITQESFYTVPINRYGTSLGGMMSKLYKGSPYRALRDLIDNDLDFADYKDFQPYDLLRCPQNTWYNEEGVANLELARASTKLLLSVTQKQTGQSIEQALANFTQDTITDTLVNRYGTKLDALLKIYNASPYAALRDLIDNDPEFEDFKDFQPYDMKFAPQGTWFASDGGVNYALARRATKRLVKTVQERMQLPLEQVLPNVWQDEFNNTPINRYNTTLSGMMNRVYGGSPFDALKDLIDSDPEFAEYRDFQPYDMTSSPKNTWLFEDGNRNVTLARSATKLLITKLQSESGKSIENVLSEITQDTICTTPINRYGTRLSGVSFVYDGSAYAAIKDLIEHDGDFSQFRDFMPYDMHVAPQNTWTGKDGSRNYSLGRSCTKRLLKKLEQDRKQPLEIILPTITKTHFASVEIDRYGATLAGMLALVYDDSPAFALRDVISNDPEYTHLRI